MSLKEEKRELAKKLIKLALNEGATEEECNSTAVRSDRRVVSRKQ